MIFQVLLWFWVHNNMYMYFIWIKMRKLNHGIRYWRTWEISYRYSEDDSDGANLTLTVEKEIKISSEIKNMITCMYSLITNETTLLTSDQKTIWYCWKSHWQREKECNVQGRAEKETFSIIILQKKQRDPPRGLCK